MVEVAWHSHKTCRVWLSSLVSAPHALHLLGGLGGSGGSRRELLLLCAGEKNSGPELCVSQEEVEVEPVELSSHDV